MQSLQYTLDYLLRNYARRTSAHAISGVLKNLALPCRREIIADYLAFFKDAYLFHPVSVMSDSLAVKRVNPDKYYVIDTGLVNAVTPKRDAGNATGTTDCAIVTWEDEGLLDDGIRIVPAWKWCLERDAPAAAIGKR